MLVIRKLSVCTGNKTILNDINFTFEKGKIYALMGANGSGKSTLAQTIMGDPRYKVSSGKISFNCDRKKVFLSFQNPPSIEGVNIYQLYFQLLGERLDLLAIKERIEQIAENLKIKKELLERSLNSGFSGGERKKMEVLQALLLEPSLAIFDEVDSGVDINALKIITKNLTKLKSKENTFIIISHNQRIFDYLKVDQVLIMSNGQIVKTGDINLIKKVEKEGYV